LYTYLFHRMILLAIMSSVSSPLPFLFELTLSFPILPDLFLSQTFGVTGFTTFLSSFFLSTSNMSSAYILHISNYIYSPAARLISEDRFLNLPPPHQCHQ
jgi:hypothetical protein